MSCRDEKLSAFALFDGSSSRFMQRGRGGFVTCLGRCSKPAERIAFRQHCTIINDA
jgi:hypothetical protein